MSVQCWPKPDRAKNFVYADWIGKIPRTRRISSTIREHVYERDGWRCTYCAAELARYRVENCEDGGGDRVVYFRDGKYPTLDHVVPKSKGGWNHPANLVAACVNCNSQKGSRWPDDWKRR